MDKQSRSAVLVFILLCNNSHFVFLSFFVCCCTHSHFFSASLTVEEVNRWSKKVEHIKGAVCNFRGIHFHLLFYLLKFSFFFLPPLCCPNKQDKQTDLKEQHGFILFILYIWRTPPAHQPQQVLCDLIFLSEQLFFYLLSLYYYPINVVHKLHSAFKEAHSLILTYS